MTEPITFFGFLVRVVSVVIACAAAWFLGHWIPYGSVYVQVGVVLVLLYLVEGLLTGLPAIVVASRRTP